MKAEIARNREPEKRGRPAAYFLDRICFDFVMGYLIRDWNWIGDLLFNYGLNDLFEGCAGTLLKLVADANDGERGLYNMAQARGGGIDDQFCAGAINRLA